MHAYLVQCAKSHSTGSTFQQIETLESSAINDAWSMFLTVLYMVDSLETETLKWNLINNGLIPVSL